MSSTEQGLAKPHWMKGMNDNLHRMVICEEITYRRSKLDVV